MSRLTPTKETFRTLFALSGNCCAYPGCTHALISEKGTFIAQLCHIEAANKGGERYNPEQTDEERRSFENLLLLCYAHHRETDYVNEFPKERLREIKKNHEEKFRQNQYQLSENVLEKATLSIQIELDKLLQLSQDTNITVHSIDEKLDEMLKRTASPADGKEDSIYTSQLDSFKDLKKQGKYQTAIDLLVNFKEKNWNKVTPETKYKVVANIAMCYLDLHDKEKAIEYLNEIEKIGYESAESLANLCLGYALAQKEKEFDLNFQKAIVLDKENVNLWVAYIHRHKKQRTEDQFIKELPQNIIDSVPVLFARASLLFDEGRKKEAIAHLKKILEKQQETPEKLSDTKALIASQILKDLLDPFKFQYSNYDESELKELEDAKELFTEAWDVLGETEMAKSKWYIILNRGVINKITGNIAESIYDFQKAYDISREFLPFKNLLFAHLQFGNVEISKKLLSNPGIARTLNEQETFELQTFKARLLCYEGKIQNAVTLLSELLDHNKQDQYIEILRHIIATCFEFQQVELAAPWCERLLNEFPARTESHVFYGFLCMMRGDNEKALQRYDQAQVLLTAATPANDIYQLVSGYMKLEEYEKAIPLFERLANKNLLNEFSRGLIHAYYKFGDLQAALAIAENLNDKYPGNQYLIEIISNIYRESKQYDKAIDIIKSFLPGAVGFPKDFFNLRCAYLYSSKRDWNNVRHFALQIENPESFTIDEAFDIAGLLIRAGEEEKGLAVAYNARTHFFDDSHAHVRYINACLKVVPKESDLYPSVVQNDCAVIIKTGSGEQKTFLITDKNTSHQNILRPDDTFALQLIGKSINEEVLIDRGYGFSSIITIIGILDIYIHAFRESLQLFETRFAGQQKVNVLRAYPGQPGDEVEDFIKSKAIESNTFQKQVYDLYNQGKATLGVLAGFFKQNCVKQWFVLINSPDVSVVSIRRNEIEAAESAINKIPLVLDLTSLLTMFFISREKNFFDLLDNEFLISQSTLDELLEFYEEWENSKDSGIFSLDYQNGNMVGHTISAEAIQRNLTILQNLIDWCHSRTQIIVPSKLLQVKRNERERMAEILNDCFYDTILLAQEYNVAVISDDDNFKSLLRACTTPLPFSTYQLVHNLIAKEKISKNDFEILRLQLILHNHIYIPLDSDQLWQCFDASGFKLAKPFTVAVKGLIIMHSEHAANHIAAFFKKISLEAGLINTKEQTIFYILNEISIRKDFSILKILLIKNINTQFKLLPTLKDNVLQIVNAFT